MVRVRQRLKGRNPRKLLLLLFQCSINGWPCYAVSHVASRKSTVCSMSSTVPPGFGVQTSFCWPQVLAERELGEKNAVWGLFLKATHTVGRVRDSQFYDIFLGWLSVRRRNLQVSVSGTGWFSRAGLTSFLTVSLTLRFRA